MVHFTRRLSAACLIGVALVLPARAATMVVHLLLANVWSFTAHSKTLLADRGYELAYLFEFIDEEELRVRGTGDGEILEGRIRTILDGDPVEATIRLQGEARILHVARDLDRLVAAWQVDGRLVASDLPPEEVQRRWGLMLALLRETRRRLDLEGFSPSTDYAVPLPIVDLDLLVLVPAKPTPHRYEIHRPGRADVVELLITEAGGKRWEITWGVSELRVRTSPPLDPARMVAKGFSFLESARLYFGTAPITAALPTRRPR